MPKSKDPNETQAIGKGRGRKNEQQNLSTARDSTAGANDPAKDKLSAGLYVFSDAVLYPRPGQGPLVVPTYNITKKSGKKELYLGSNWQDFMNSLNSPVAYGRIKAKDWGPSKGLNDKNMLIFNTLIYPGRNIVQITGIVSGTDGGKWGRVSTLDVSSIPAVEKAPDGSLVPPQHDAPHHFHAVYGCKKNGSWFPLDNTPTVPIIGDGEQWVQMEMLRSIDNDLPKTVTVTIEAGLSVYAAPGDLNTKKADGDLAKGQSAQVSEVRIARGGIWGNTESGWIALRLYDQNPTDWII